MKILNPKMSLDGFFEKLSEESLLILDYDGTLAPLVTDRLHAYPYSGVLERLRTLAALEMTRVVILSGRSLEELEEFLPIANLEMWGSHGLERKLPNGEEHHGEIDVCLREGLTKGTEICLAKAGADYCEIKPLAVAFHWRGMDEERKRFLVKSIEPLWKQLTLDYALEMLHFDGGIELRPQGFNKGSVTTMLLRQCSPSCSVAYLGDDITDEEAFEALSNRGLKILMREQFHPTKADVHLQPPNELLEFLDKWILTAGHQKELNAKRK